MDKIEEEQRKELMDLEQKYFRKDGENMALNLLLKTKRRY